MNDDILSILEYKMPTLSKGQKRIAALICESCEKVAFMTANALGKEAAVSEATVVRFAAELGYSGYPQMQKAMQETVLSRMTLIQRMGLVAGKNDSQDIFSSVLQSDADNLHKSGRMVHREDFYAAVENILKAKNIYIIGAQSTSVLANFLGYYLQYMFDGVTVITDSATGEVMEKLMRLNHQDVVIAFSFPRYATSTLHAANYCRSVGATVVGFTNSLVSPLTKYCEYVLPAKSDMISIVDSLVAPLSMVNALIAALAAGKENVLQSNMDKLESIWQTYHIYEKKDDAI